MKTLTQSVQLIGASLVFLALAACGKSGDSGNNVAAIQYGYQNSQCYDLTHNTPAAANLCGTTQYQYLNNQCVSTVNGNTPVDPIYCQQALYSNQYNQYNQYGYNQYGYPTGALPMGTGYAAYFGTNYYPNTYNPAGGYGGQEACVGMYYQYSGYTGQLMQCGNGFSCSGMFLYKTTTKVRVLCL